MAELQKCVHKGCGKKFSDPEEACVYHPGPPVFHEGQKGWQCCKPRVLTFDEFLTIPPCTTGKHSTVDDTPAPPPKPKIELPSEPELGRKPVQSEPERKPQAPQATAVAPPPPEPESEDDDPSLPIPSDKTCRRRGCRVTSTASTAQSRDGETCTHHPGQPVFHEGQKGWSCCKKRVLEFDEFMKIEGCQEKSRHMFVGSGKTSSDSNAEKQLDSIRSDFYQTSTTVHASLYLKKINKNTAKVVFSSPTTIDLDLATADKTRYKTSIPLFGAIDTEKSTFRILGTKVGLELVKADGASWPVLRADDQRTGEIIQTGRAGRA